jgi:hypothetical protein|nr:MAG TPA: hypothetical protein [Caudoviricetes sp.]
MELMTLNEVFTDWINNGIFKYLQALDVPWKNYITSNELDVIYHGSRSGKKFAGCIVENFLSNNVLSDESKALIAQAIFAINQKNWVALWNTLNLEYNPIDNYNMVESENISDVHSGTLTSKGEDVTTKNDSLTNSQNTTNTTTNKDTVTTANTGNVTKNVTENGTNKNEQDVTKSTSENTVANNANTNQLYGFNSVDAVNSDKQIGDVTQDVTGSETVKDVTNVTTTGTTTDETSSTNNGTVTTESSIKNDVGLTGASTNETNVNVKRDNTDTENKTITTDRTLTRKGNIGVTTSQQMIESERKLWFWSYFEKVFSDVDNILTLKIY